MVVMLHHDHVCTWVKLHVLAQTLYGCNTQLKTILENYNLWHIQTPVDRIQSQWTNTQGFSDIVLDVQ